MSRPFIPAANCASIELIYSSNNQTVENTFHTHKGSPYSAADLVTLRGLFNTWDSTTWSPLRSQYCVLQRIRTKALDSLGSPMEDYALPTPRPGGVALGSLPNNVTYAIKLATGLTGRSFRGRIYCVGLTTGHFNVSNYNEIAAASSNSLVTALNTLLTNLAAGGHTLGVLSYMFNKAWRTNGLFTPATGWTAIDLHFDSQRRRLTGRGL